MNIIFNYIFLTEKEIIEITDPIPEVETVEGELSEPEEEKKIPSLKEAKFYFEQLELFFDSSELQDEKNVEIMSDLRHKLNNIEEKRKYQKKNFFF